ncbi:hypothetical protein QR680_007082 [Steinernema hermaphroditum]|uniref:Uncharacterized protein n=1 Tax=Steinernema hermaphroditum TaxID=289476 RepID=A0AA39HXK0_9BILA|nr:hypothetical protein QR680_007082 [Steinernema hermaphroditum]
MSIDTARKKDNRDGVHVVTDFISCRLRNPERLSIKQVYNFMKWNIHLEHGRRYPCGFKVSRLYPKYYVVTDFICCRLRNPERFSIKQVYSIIPLQIRFVDSCASATHRFSQQCVILRPISRYMYNGNTCQGSILKLRNHLHD